MCIHTYIHTHIHTYPHVHTYIYTYSYRTYKTKWIKKHEIKFHMSLDVKTTYGKARSSRLLVYFKFYDLFWSQNYNGPFEEGVSKPVRKRKHTDFGQNI